MYGFVILNQTWNDVLGQDAKVFNLKCTK